MQIGGEGIETNSSIWCSEIENLKEHQSKKNILSNFFS
jgi:hypothetical protein